MDENWDLTMQRVIPYINGVNSVKRIAQLADADLKLTRKAIRHLLYYGCVLLLDIFSFNAIYAPTAEFAGMIASDMEMQKECARYVNVGFGTSETNAVQSVDVGRAMAGGTGSLSGANGGQLGAGTSFGTALDAEDIFPLTGKGEVVDGVSIVQLYSNMRQGLTVREWYAQNANMLANIDLRRFVTFGVIKGFLYRVHRYAIRVGGNHLDDAKNAEISKKRKKRNGYHDGDGDNEEESKVSDKDINAFLDGTHCFDEICTEFMISERELMERLKRRELGEISIICR